MSVKRATIDEDELIAALALARSETTPCRDRVELVRRVGSCKKALQKLTSRPDSSLDHARRELDALRAKGFEALALTDASYPRLLKMALDPPLVLTLWGQLATSDGLSLAIVGSRRATRYGLEMAAGLAGELAWAGLTIVSGLARGIDGAAHRGALEKQGRTIAILGSGLSNIYPSEHRRLAERIAENGAVLSEFATGEPPRARNFPRRNRILTGMTLGTIVVEAALKSGSLISARHALEQNREVFAVPGPARAENSAGVHALIRDGATLVTDARDVVQELRPEIRKLLRERRPAAASAPPELDEHERAVFTELRRAQSAVDVDALLERVDMPTERALSALCGLEVKGHIWRLGSGLYQVKP